MLPLGRCELDELFENARRLKADSLPCASCGGDLAFSSRARACAACGAHTIVFRSVFQACCALMAIRKVRRVVVAPTRYVPDLGWIVGYRFQVHAA